MALRELIWKASATDNASSTIKNIDKGFDGLSQKMQNTSKGLKDFGKSVGKIGGGLTKKLTLPIVGAATAGVKMAMDVETGVKKVSTLADKEVLPVSKIEKEARKISDITGKSQNEILESMYSGLSAGVDSKDIVDFTESGVDLARAGFTDMETVIDTTTTILNAYGEQAYETSKIHDILITTQDKGKTTVAELGANIGKVIPTASSLSVNMDQLGASYAILTAKGLGTADATTSINAMLNELSASGGKADKVLKKKTGKSFEQLSKEGKNVGEILGIIDEEARKSGKSLGDYFGNSAKKAANTLNNTGVEAYEEMMKTMEESDGATQKNAETMMTSAEKVRIALNKMKNNLIDLGAELVPFVEKAAEGIGKLAEKFSGLSDEQRETFVKWAGIAAIAGPALIIIGKIATGIGGLITVVGKLGGAASLLTSPWVAAVGAMIGIGIALYQNWDTVKAKWGQLREVVSQKITGTIQAVTGWFTEKVESARGLWQRTKTLVSAGIKGTVQAVTGAFNTAVQSVREKWQSLKEFLSKPIKGVVSVAQKAWQGTKNLGKKVMGSHKTGLDNVPADGYVAELHKDEMVLTKSAANQYRAMGGTKDGLRGGQTQGTTNTSNATNNITINVNGSTSPQVTAQAIRQELDNYFGNLSLQGI